MSLFGTSPPGNETSLGGGGGGGEGMFDDPPSKNTGGGNSLFTDDGDNDGDSPWSMPTPRKKKSRADMIRELLPASDVPDSYVETFDTVVRNEGGRAVSSDGIAKLFAAARLSEPATQARIVSLVTPEGSSSSDSIALGRGEFNVLLALVGLAQEGEVISLDGVDERRRNLPQPKLAGLTAEPVLPPVDELAAKPPQTPVKDRPQADRSRNLSITGSSSGSPGRMLRPAMDDPEDDPWNTPDVHKNHAHAQVKPNGAEANGHRDFDEMPSPTIAGRSISQHASTADISTTATTAPSENPGSNGTQRHSGSSGLEGGWGGAGGFNDGTQDVVSPFGGAGMGAPGGTGSGSNPPPAPIRLPRSTSGRTGNAIEENILVALMPEKEGMFMFQHHNYEVSSQRRGSKVIRRYSDFVWLLDCLQKRYPFRVLPLLPPKRVAVNGNHLSNDNLFIEKRRRGLARFLNALVRHPVLTQEQLVVMFLTVPTELANWRKQATVSVEDEFIGRALPPHLEESLPPSLEDLFAQTRSGVRRSAELYINTCNVMDRIAKRQEGVAADHGRMAAALQSLTETSADTYATETSEVPLLNDGLAATGRHLQTCQQLLEDESRGWDEGVLEDLKRQRDALVSVREMFDRRERLDKDNIPYLERRIQANETKLANLRSKPEGIVKAGDIEKVAEAIIKDKESIVQQHNRSIFVKECIRDELLTFQSSQYHVSRWNQDWAGERVKYAEMLSDNWRRLLDELEGMPVGD